MAITAALKRNHSFRYGDGSIEVSTASLTGTYVTGGFTFDLKGLTGGSGSSPYWGTPVVATWQSPLGYQYSSTFAGSVMTTKVFSAANVELAAGANPEASVPFQLTRRRITA